MTMDISKSDASKSTPSGLGGGQQSSNGPPNNGTVPNSGSSSVTQHHQSAATGGIQHECAGCGKLITERFLLRALDLFWHEDCLKCGCCDCRLGEVGSTLYTKANLILCKRDYLR